uniref:Uncharacterized protein n=1 Tax=Ipomoea batatas TaxID=4120 RepID=F8J388_IPOBA|nr:hypothetical protein [Ipomoea batatas]
MTNEPYTERMYCRRCKNASVQQGTALRIGRCKTRRHWLLSRFENS